MIRAVAEKPAFQGRVKQWQHVCLLLLISPCAPKQSTQHTHMILQIWCQAHNSHLTLKRWQPVFGGFLTQNTQPGLCWPEPFMAAAGPDGKPVQSEASTQCRYPNLVPVRHPLCLSHFSACQMPCFLAACCAGRLQARSVQHASLLKRFIVLQVNAPFDLSGRTRILPHAEPEVDVDMTESAEPKEKRPRITVTLPGARSTPPQQVGHVPSWV